MNVSRRGAERVLGFILIADIVKQSISNATLFFSPSLCPLRLCGFFTHTPPHYHLT